VFSLRSLIGKNDTIIEAAAREKDLHITVYIADSIPDNLVGDDRRFSQVLTNILSNAVKFTPDGGKISVEVTAAEINPESVLVQVSVTDSGIGISEDQQQNIFTAFEQADKDPSRKYGGTGLGLALSKKLVELMGGGISFKSASGMGSTFTFTCRFAVASEDSISSEPLSEPQENEPNLSGKRILIAEDIEINREILAALLEPTNAEIFEAVDGNDAVDVFLRCSPDIIFMDLQMPEVDGYEATRRIRASGAKNAKTVPIIAMTANVFKEDVERCLDAGMNDHLGKPVDLSEMMRKLRKYLG
jgi:CheY-like chemotaxis protein